MIDVFREVAKKIADGSLVWIAWAAFLAFHLAWVVAICLRGWLDWHCEGQEE